MVLCLGRFRMNVLIACEFSGIVRRAFAKKGHTVTSCDLLPTERLCKKGNEYHYQGDIYDWLNQFSKHNGLPYELMIAFPPCTHLAASGARWFKNKVLQQENSLAFVRYLMTRDIERICIENPIGIISTHICKPTQIIQPWMFGHGETKATCLWLKNLPDLKPTNIVDGRKPRVHYEPPSPDRWKNRSRTYQGIADAMASQWT